jgi:hypothetical protein
MLAKKMKSAAALFCGVFIFACATIEIDLPSITDSPTGDFLPGKIVWHDLLTDDVEASRKFYGTLFGWEFESVGNDAGLGNHSAYTLIRHDGRLIGGMIDTVLLNGRDDISQWVAVMSVADIDAATAQFEAQGGEIITPPTDLQRRGRLAIVRDAEGALLALLQSRDGDPADSPPQIDEFLWDELWTLDVDNAIEFYTAVSDLHAGELAGDELPAAAATYTVLKSGDKPRVGILANPLPDLGPVWVSYLRVESPAQIAEKVDELGGRVIVAAQPRAIGGEVAFIAGPSGAGIALQTWPLEKKN